MYAKRFNKSTYFGTKGYFYIENLDDEFCNYVNFYCEFNFYSDIEYVAIKGERKFTSISFDNRLKKVIGRYAEYLNV